MKKLKIRNYDDKDFLWIENLMLESFSIAERPSKKQLQYLLSRENAIISIIEKNNEKIGFLISYDMRDFIFTDYLTIVPNMRNKGYGREILKKAMTFLDKPLIFECETPSFSEMAKRRYSFYLKLGFFDYGINYKMPSLDIEEKPISMRLMGGNSRIEDEQLDDLIRTLYTKVYSHVIDFPQNQLLLENLYIN